MAGQQVAPLTSEMPEEDEDLRLAEAQVEWSQAYTVQAQDAWHMRWDGIYQIVPTGICSATKVVRR